MKKVFLSLGAIMILCTSYSQEVDKTKVRELGLTTHVINILQPQRFGVTYRTGNENSVWRFNVLRAGGDGGENTVDSIISSNMNFNVQLSIGREWRKPLNEKWDFRYGTDVNLSYGYFKSERGWDNEEVWGYSDIRNNYGAGINFVLGVNHTFNSHFVVGAELLPGIEYSIAEDSRRTIQWDESIEEQVTERDNISFNVFSSPVLLSAAYRF